MSACVRVCVCVSLPAPRVLMNACASTLTENFTMCPRSAPKRPKTPHNLRNLAWVGADSPKPRTGRILGYVARNAILRAPRTPTTPQFLWFPPRNITHKYGNGVEQIDSCFKKHSWGLASRQSRRWLAQNLSRNCALDLVIAQSGSAKITPERPAGSPCHGVE